MTQPQLRISPSGPLAGDGPISPFTEYAGAIFQGVAESIPDPVGYLAARIGPASGLHAPSAVIRRGGTGTVAGPAVGNAIFNAFLPVGGSTPEILPYNDEFVMGEGTWLVEAELGMGFASSLPTGNACGALSAAFELLSNAGVVVNGATSPLDETPRGVANGVLTAVQAGLVHSTRFKGLITITPAMIAANLNQSFKSFRAVLTRVNGSTNYGTESGWLQFTTNSLLSIRRFR